MNHQGGRAFFRRQGMQRNVKTSKKKNISISITIVKTNAIVLTFLLSCTVLCPASIDIPTSELISPPNEKNIIWDATITITNAGSQNDYVIFGEAPDANDGPPADPYDVVKPPAPMPPYIRTWLNDNLPLPYDSLWMDYRHYPSSSKTWNLTVHWMPSSGSSPTTITMLWTIAEIAASEYTNVTLCTNDGTPLQNMLLANSYVFSCPAYVPQLFKIICTATNLPPIANDDSITVQEDTSNNQINVLLNDDDPENDELTILSVTQPSHGTSTTNGDYCFYTPTPHYHGSDSFTYTISDTYGSTDTATVFVTVQAKPYYLTITIQGSGTVTKTPDQQSYTYGQVVTLTANPASGWMFNHWGGDLSGDINPTIITMNGNKSIIANFTLSNQPPNTPGKPNGPAQGNIKETYTYTAVTTDADGDQISYQFDWGDGSISNWIGPFNSGITASASHTWTKKGNYGIKVKAKDSHGAESAWSESLPITMPLSQGYNPPNIARFIDFLFRFFQGHFVHLLFMQWSNLEA